jgi:SH3-like domain-containing protein
MQTKLGFTKMTIAEFEQWIKNLKIGRTILKVQEHHTFSPSYIHFKGSNHFELQQGMKNHHVNHNGWDDIGQHFTIFPDGTILTGRSMEKSPACITGQNANAICIENLGNFDTDGDTMTDLQKEAIVQVTALLCKRFGLAVNSNSIVYHHWFDLKTGARNNGTKNNKSCPGTNFFGGNKVQDCETHFLPLVRAKLAGTVVAPQAVQLIKYGVVTAKTLTVRVNSSPTSNKATDRVSIALGAVIRVFKEQDGWLKISNSQEHWVSGKFIITVKKAVVNADTLNVRSGSDASFPKIGSYLKGEEVFVVEEKKGWCKVSMDEKWVSKQFLTF